MIPLLIVLLAPTQAISALSWSDNLLINPGAETAAMAPWITETPVVVSQSRSETSGWVYPHSGDWFFNMAGAPASPSGTLAIRELYQDIDLSSYAADIDAGLLQIQAAVWLQTEDVPTISGADYAQLTIFFLNESGGQIDALSTGLVQSPNLTWVKESLEGTAPMGTRGIRFELLGKKHETSYINAFFDDANLQVAIPEPGTLCLLTFASLTLLRRRRP
jgi:hypothetical protein